MPKKSTALPAFEDYLAPWEVDGDGKPLEEPADLDPARLKKYLYGLLSDKEKGQTRVAELETERDAAVGDLQELQRKVETDDERRAREETERNARYAEIEKKAKEREKVEALEEHFKDQGITAERAKRLAKRVTGDDEAAWIESADELVEDGFRISEKKAEEKPVEDDEPLEDLSIRPRVRRSNGQVPEAVVARKPKSVDDVLNDAIPVRGW